MKLLFGLLKDRQRFTVFFTMLIFMGGKSFARPNYQRENFLTEHEVYIKILSYNIKGLPSLISGTDSKRFKDIAQVISDRRSRGEAPDIVLVQEAFISETSELMQNAGYKNIFKGPGKSGTDQKNKSYKKIFGSGLYIMTDMKVTDQGNGAFDRNDCNGWDCFANKGFQWVTVQIPGAPVPLMIWNTHLQADKKHEKSRLKQMATVNSKLSPLIKQNKAVVFGGDFNSNPSRGSYAEWLKMSKLSNVGTVCFSNSDCEVLNDTDPEMLVNKTKDQIFFSQGNRLKVDVVSLERNFSEEFNGRMLSDHLGYEAVLRVSWK